MTVEPWMIVLAVMIIVGYFFAWALCKIAAQADAREWELAKERMHAQADAQLRRAR